MIMILCSWYGWNCWSVRCCCFCVEQLFSGWYYNGVFFVQIVFMIDLLLYINVKLNVWFQFEYWLQLFEDLFDVMFEVVGIGEILGGGMVLFEDGEVEYGDLEIQLYDVVVLLQVIELFEQFGVLKGLLIQCDGEDDLLFGIIEGLGLYLDGVNLLDEVYEQCDLNYVFDQIVECIDGYGEICSWWQGLSEIGLYLYGVSFDILCDCIVDLFVSYLLCQGVCVVWIV